VHGASEAGLLLLLSRGFLMLLLFAACIAMPLTYLFFDQVLLPEMGNAAPLSILDIAGGSCVVLLIALVMIASQTRKVARANPADVLKSE
jgi:hypothetical protein